jgi:hypothetical protein
LRARDRTVGELHLTPVRAVLQMRPSLAYLDDADARRREDARPPEDDESSAGEEEAKAVQVLTSSCRNVRARAR